MNESKRDIIDKKECDEDRVPLLYVCVGRRLTRHYMCVAWFFFF